MSVEILVRCKIDNRVYDVSTIAEGVTWSTDLMYTPGTFEFNIVDARGIRIREGDEVTFKIDSITVFYGWVFTREGSEEGGKKIVCYDQLRYFKNKTVRVRESTTASTLFKNICEEFKLKYKVVTETKTTLPPYAHDNTSLYDILHRAMQETTVAETNFYMIRDNAGTLEFLNPLLFSSGLLLGDTSLVGKYNFNSSIDENTYNVVKVTYKDDKLNKREVFNIYANDYEETGAKWGILSEVYESDVPLNPAKANEIGKNWLALRSSPSKVLLIPDCIGDLRVRGGSVVAVFIKELFDEEGITGAIQYIVRSCTHTFKNGEHKMNLELVIPKEV